MLRRCCACLLRCSTEETPRSRFLSAVRLQEAKKPLLSTTLSITEIRVGCSSVGTFSSRFKSSAGLSPSAYRELHGYAPPISEDRRFRRHTTVVQGEISPPPGVAGGAFSRPSGRPEKNAARVPPP